ncbi:MAG: hypothetical protein IJE00_00400 [Clostridia bacterium]|nr:hypothetical protein [Clostridia bacterium]
MSYYSDPTAALAMGNINREFARLTKKAKRIRARLEEGTMSWDEVERAEAQFTGIYRNVLRNVLAEDADKQASS